MLTATSTRYVHTLLFRCPDCDSPIAISCVNEGRNLEATDGESLRIFCTSCYNSSYVIGLMAKKHYVENWQ
jgi:hypothetical protein